MLLTLYSYWRSTTSYRVRIALHLKGLDFETVSVNLLEGEQQDEAYTALNPVQGVPTLVTEDGAVLTQSMAILGYLDDIAPDPKLLPTDNSVMRAKVLSAAMLFATDVHPVNNLKVVKHLTHLTGEQQDGIDWMRHWMRLGFVAFDALIERDTDFAFGDTPTIADICLVAQLYNAHRWTVDLSDLPRLTEIETRCLALPAFNSARPENQMDAT